MSDPKLRHGSKHCKCPACGEYFTTVTNFDLHRRGEGTERYCVPPGKLVTKRGRAKLRLNLHGLWTRAEGVYLGGRDE